MLLLSFVFIGGILFNNRLLRVPALFSPLVWFSQLSLVIYLGALLDLLNPTAVLVTFFGIAAFIFFGGSILYHFLKSQNKKDTVLKLIRDNENTVVGYTMALSAIALFIYLKQSLLLYGYDAFSRWGLLVKEMEEYGKLPNLVKLSFTDTFLDYPPIEGIFIYYFQSLIGFSDLVLILGFVVLNMAIGVCLFSLVKQRSYIAYGIVVIAILILFLIMPYGLCTILVEPLIIGLSATLLMIYIEYKHNLRLLFTIFTPVLCFFILLKKSTIILALILLIIIIADLIYHKNIKSKLTATVLLSYTVGIIFQYSWKVFYQYNLTNNEEGKFSKFALSNIHVPQRRGIIKHFYIAVWSYGNWELFLATMVFIALMFLCYGIGAKNSLVFILVSFGIYGFWCLQLLCLYVFLMPLEEAITYSGMNRYALSLVASILYFALIIAIKLVPGILYKPVFKFSSVFVFGAALSFIFVPFTGGSIFEYLMVQQNYPQNPYYQVRKQVQEAAKGCAGNCAKDFVVYSDSQFSDYLHYVTQFELLDGTKQKTFHENSLDELKQRLSAGDISRLVVLKHDEKINQFVANYGLKKNQFYYEPKK